MALPCPAGLAGGFISGAGVCLCLLLASPPSPASLGAAELHLGCPEHTAASPRPGWRCTQCPETGEHSGAEEAAPKPRA